MIKTFKFFIFATLFLTILSTNLFAQGSDQSASTNETMQEATTPAAMKPVEYNLAYPGILPDNPLYILKKIRDKVSVFLITDPKKKVDFYLLQTDKGILASAILVDKNKVDLAIDTALKAENNYTLLTYELKNIPEKPDDAYFSKLRDAGLKHQEVLSQITTKVPEDKKGKFTQVLNFSKTNLKTIEDYQAEKSIE